MKTGVGASPETSYILNVRQEMVSFQHNIGTINMMLFKQINQPVVRYIDTIAGCIFGHYLTCYV